MRGGYIFKWEISFVEIDVVSDGDGDGFIVYLP